MSKPFHLPPIQRTHPLYRVTLPWVASAVTRFHRITGTDGMEHLPPPGEPMVLISNHQNGLMDPLVHCTLLGGHQVHWLTRSDVFNGRFLRFLLFGFNMMPIFRRRDRLTDINERNQRIFEVCVARLDRGATVGLYPEGNHAGEPSLRPLKRGVTDLLAMARRAHPGLACIHLVPVGLDYEDYGAFRRNLRYRVGAPIAWHDLWDEATQQLDVPTLVRRMESALRALMVDVPQPGHLRVLHPYVRALRSTECTPEGWRALQTRVGALATLTESALAHVARAWDAAEAQGIGSRIRPEDLGTAPEEVRPIPYGTLLLTAWAWILALPSLPVALFIGTQARRKIRDICFVSTFKLSVGMLLFPLTWLLTATASAAILRASVPEAVAGVGGFWSVVLGAFTLQLLSTRAAGIGFEALRDARNSVLARRAWNHPPTAQAWLHYLRSVENPSSDR